jgi:hypothetical protein
MAVPGSRKLRGCGVPADRRSHFAWMATLCHAGAQFRARADSELAVGARQVRLDALGLTTKEATASRFVSPAAASVATRS